MKITFTWPEHIALNDPDGHIPAGHWFVTSWPRCPNEHEFVIIGLGNGGKGRFRCGTPTTGIFGDVSIPLTFVEWVE